MPAPIPAPIPVPGRYSGADFLLRAEGDLQRYNDWIVASLARAMTAAGLARPQRVLDFGCGIGTLSRIFERRTGIRPEGVEIDAGQLALYRDRGFAGHAALADARADYELIFTSNVLEHIPDDRTSLRELHAHLAPGGLLLVYVPAFELLWTRMDDKVGHQRRYTRGGLQSRLQEAGFAVLSTRYCDSLGFLAALAFRLLDGGADEPSSAALRLYDRWVLPPSRLLDVVLHPLLGKNVLAVARKPG